MKRHPALVPLSRDHHHALVIARRLRNATSADAADATRAFLVQWEEEEQTHFRLEEEILLPAYAAYGVNQPAIPRALLDHRIIRRDAARLADAPPLEVLHELGSRLAAHVEFEERELFPLIERTLSEPELATLGERLRRAG